MTNKRGGTVFTLSFFGLYIIRPLYDLGIVVKNSKFLKWITKTETSILGKKWYVGIYIYEVGYNLRLIHVDRIQKITFSTCPKILNCWIKRVLKSSQLRMSPHQSRQISISPFLKRHLSRNLLFSYTVLISAW